MKNAQYEVEYKGGHPLWNKPEKAILSTNKDFGALYLRPSSIFSLTKPITINKDDIIAIDFERSSSRSAGKAVAGALIGGVLTGGVGLLIGGSMGAKKKNLSELYLRIKYNDRELMIALKTGKDTDRIYSEINSLFA